MSRHFTLLLQQRAAGMNRGIYSVCSAHPWVLEAAMHHALLRDAPLLIEATHNQVNQFGGYTDIQSVDYRTQVESIAAHVGFLLERIIPGGDHLGAHPWQHLAPEEAMTHAIRMIVPYVQTGFS